MKETVNSGYVKRTQKDYSMSFKLQVVAEVESEELSINGALRKYGIQGHSTVLAWIRKYGTFDREYQIQRVMAKTPEQNILELEQKIKLRSLSISYIQNSIFVTVQKLNNLCVIY